MKATAVQHHDNGERAIHELYGIEGRKHLSPRAIDIIIEEGDHNVNFSVKDQAFGLSVDEALGRFRNELADRLQSQTIEEVQHSVWYKQAKRVLGERQIEHMFAWPTNPLAIRDVTIGTVFDIHYIMAFGGDSWGLRSMTSGMGLWGVRYFTELLGGAVVGTNQFDGGAQFTVSVPKENVGL